MCDTQWSGNNCDIYLDPCASTPCNNGAHCGPTTDYLSFICTCPQGYTGMLGERIISFMMYNVCSGVLFLG